MRKILVHDIKMKKNPETKEDIFWISTGFHEVMRVQSPTCTLAQTFYQWRR